MGRQPRHHECGAYPEDGDVDRDTSIGFGDPCGPDRRQRGGDDGNGDGCEGPEGGNRNGRNNGCNHELAAGQTQ
jgi:hypothetical protein